MYPPEARTAATAMGGCMRATRQASHSLRSHATIEVELTVTTTEHRVPSQAVANVIEACFNGVTTISGTSPNAVVVRLFPHIDDVDTPRGEAVHDSRGAS
eukprot:5495302-Prymnesium_polylepis.1